MSEKTVLAIAACLRLTGVPGRNVFSVGRGEELPHPAPQPVPRLESDAYQTVAAYRLHLPYYRSLHPPGDYFCFITVSSRKGNIFTAVGSLIESRIDDEATRECVRVREKGG